MFNCQSFRKFMMQAMAGVVVFGVSAFAGTEVVTQSATSNSANHPPQEQECERFQKEIPLGTKSYILTLGRTCRSHDFNAVNAPTYFVKLSYSGSTGSRFNIGFLASDYQRDRAEIESNIKRILIDGLESQDYRVLNSLVLPELVAANATITAKTRSAHLDQATSTFYAHFTEKN